MMREGRPKGSRTCDFLTTVVFLRMFRRRPLNAYQVHHYEDGSAAVLFDHKKLYRYLRYCQSLGLLELDRIDNKDGVAFLPAKYYRLTVKGQELVDVMQLDPWLRPKNQSP